jgi:hypothetical protein
LLQGVGVQFQVEHGAQILLVTMHIGQLEIQVRESAEGLIVEVY